MSISSIEIQEQGFGTERNGYNMKEVDIFLEHVANEIDQMQADFDYELSAAKEAAAQAAGPNPEQEDEIRRLNDVIAELQRQLSEQKTNESVISEAFIAAQKSANSIKEDARAQADQTIADAEDKAHQIIDEAADEKQRIIDEIDRLDKSRADFVEEYTSLIKHFNDDATKVFTRQNLSLDSSVRAAHEPVKTFGTEPSARDSAVRPQESMPTPSASSSSNGNTLYGAVDTSDSDDDLD